MIRELLQVVLYSVVSVTVFCSILIPATIILTPFLLRLLQFYETHKTGNSKIQNTKLQRNKSTVQ